MWLKQLLYNNQKYQTGEDNVWKLKEYEYSKLLRLNNMNYSSLVSRQNGVIQTGKYKISRTT